MPQRNAGETEVGKVEGNILGNGTSESADILHSYRHQMVQDVPGSSIQSIHPSIISACQLEAFSEVSDQVLSYSALVSECLTSDVGL